MNRRVRLGGWGLVSGAERTVITPNENAADTLDVEPRTLEDLAHELLGEGRVANPVMVWRLMQEAVATTLGGEDPDGLARAMHPAIRELFRATPETDASPSSARARRVFEVAEEYRRLLRERSLVDPAEVLWEAARECTSRIPLLVWGYPRFGRDELAFIDAVAAEGSEVRLPWSEDTIFGANLEAARELESRGWSVTEAPLERVWKPAVAVEALEYPHLEAEMRGTLARIKALLVEGVPQNDIVIVARDDVFYGPTVLSVAKEYGIPVRLLYRIAVADTRVGAWLKMLFEAAEEGFPFETTARLLAHPLGPGLSWKGWAEARRVRASGSASWEECGVKLAHLDLPHVWPEEDSRAGWTGRFEELLGATELRNRVGSAQREIIALSRLREAIGWLAQPEEEEISRERFLAEIFEAMSVTATPAYPEGEGVALHTPLSLYGARFRHVFVLGLAEGTLPAPVSEDSTLDFYERKLLGEEEIHLELAAERARRERLSFWTLLQVPRERLVLSYPKVVGSRATLASPYFELLEMEPSPPGLLPAASPEEARRAYLQREGYEDEVLEHAARAWEVERRREGTDSFDLYDGVLNLPLEAGERHFSASQLAELLRCGFKWWAGSVLGLAEPEEGESPALLGWLYHKALEAATRRCMEGPVADLRSGMLGCLEEAFSEAEEEVEADRMRAWGVRRRLHLEVLRNAISQEDFILPEDEVVATEATFTGQWRGFELAGRVDRVDRTDEGLVFVDYKNRSSRPRPDVQLAIYREAAPKALFPGEKCRDAYYYSLRTGERELLVIGQHIIDAWENWENESRRSQLARVAKLLVPYGDFMEETLSSPPERPEHEKIYATDRPLQLQPIVAERIEDRVDALGEWIAFKAAAHRFVQETRQIVLGGRVLTKEEALAFVSSPAAARFSLDWFVSHEIPVVEHTAWASHSGTTPRQPLSGRGSAEASFLQRGAGLRQERVGEAPAAPEPRSDRRDGTPLLQPPKDYGGG